MKTALFLAVNTDSTHQHLRHQVCTTVAPTCQ